MLSRTLQLSAGRLKSALDTHLHHLNSFLVASSPFYVLGLRTALPCYWRTEVRVCWQRVKRIRLEVKIEQVQNTRCLARAKFNIFSVYSVYVGAAAASVAAAPKRLSNKYDAAFSCMVAATVFSKFLNYRSS